jgi:hypothetical protein
MADTEMSLHLDYLEGVLLAQSLVLTALVKHQPAAVKKLKGSMEQAISQLDYVPMTAEKKRALANTLDKIIGGQDRFLHG